MTSRFLMLIVAASVLAGCHCPQPGKFDWVKWSYKAKPPVYPVVTANPDGTVTSEYY